MSGQLSMCVAMATFLFIYIGGHFISASPCGGFPETLTVDYTSKKLYSPGYPGSYDNNLNCEWVFEASLNLKSGFGIQLATLDLELDPSFATSVGECDDFLEVLEGAPSNLGQSLGRWCGRTLKVIKTMATSVTLRFSTNNRYTGKGFVIEYSLIRIASAECSPGTVTTIRIARAPLYETFDVKNSESRCTWNMEAVDENGDIDENSALVIEAFSVPTILCEYGKFVIYDGENTNSHKVLDWCDTDQAFSKIYLSSSYATLTFIFVEGEELEADIDLIQLKLYSRSSQYECNDTNLPSIDAAVNPVYFPLPFSKSTNGAVCKVHVSQRVRDSVRIDVMGISGQEITCNSNVIIVNQALTNIAVEKSCNRRHYPMYLPFQSDVIITSRNTARKIYLRAISNDDYCDGREITGEAYDSFVTEKKLPRETDVDNIQNNCYSRFVITTNKRKRAISLRLQWSSHAGAAFSESDVCEGAFINVYDGNSESDPLLFSSCRVSDMTDGYANTRIISTRNCIYDITRETDEVLLNIGEEQMLLLFNTDEANNAKHVNIEFFSLPAHTDLCENAYGITVDRTPQNLTSPNYPDSYPLDYTCTYKLTTNESDVIVVETVDTDFVSGCGDILTIYDGSSSILPEHLLGRICGDDVTGKKFISKDDQMILQFISNRYGPNNGGWKLLVYSEPKTAGKAQRDGGSLILTSLALLLAVVVLKV